VDALVIDTAHADNEDVIRLLRELKQQYPSIDIIAGNISSPGSAQRLCDAGADGIKVGQGGGSICTTRLVTGVGTPQVTAVYRCVQIAEQYGVPVCADGGIRYSGDICKAIGAGAHSVMLGNLLAATEETPGDIIIHDGKQCKDYRGMGSLGAMMDSKSCRERYLQDDVFMNRQGKVDARKLVPEGVEAVVPYRGKLADVIFLYTGGLRGGMGMVGAANIEELRTKVDFDRVTPGGQKEAHPHDITIVKEAPNYSVR